MGINMWLICCGSRKTQLTTTTHARSAKANSKDAFLKVEQTKGTPETIANGGHITHERGSLPDVVLPTTTMSSWQSTVDHRPSLQIDSEIFRRPTIEIEATARLAESECTVLEDPEETNYIPTKLRSHSLQSTEQRNGSQQDESTKRRTIWNSDLHSNADKRHGQLSHPSPSNNTENPPSNVNFYSGHTLITDRKYLDVKNKAKPTGQSVINKSLESSIIEYNPKQSKHFIIDGLGQLPPLSAHRFGRLSVQDGTSSVFSREYNRKSNRMTSIVPNSGKVANFRRGSLCLSSHVDEPIVTPFAQILASLRHVRANFMLLTNVTSTKDSRFGPIHGATCEDSLSVSCIPTSFQGGPHEGQLKTIATETLEELEWCLERLENIQTHRSVSDMATSKFRRMLSKELSQFSDGGQNAKQISEYICSTFLDSSELDSTAAGAQGSDQMMAEESPSIDAEKSAKKTRAPGDSSAADVGYQSQIDDNKSIKTTADTKENQPTNAAATRPQAPKDNIAESYPELMQSKLRPYGVISEKPEELSRLLTSSLDQWGMDVFELGQLTSNPLTCTFYTILQKRGLIKRFSIPEMNVIRYMNILEEHYQNVPYHNRIHATDVVQSAHVLLNAKALSAVFTELEVLAILFSCAIHDVDHPGLTNQYLINTNDQLAIMYNDSSVLENHHLAVGFQLLARPGCDIFEHLPRKQRLNLRRMTIDLVLATDMSKHMSLLADLKTMVETKKVAGSGILTLDTYSDRMQILQSVIHCADLSNPTKPLELYRKWNTRVMDEHFRQGDRERERGLELSPMCDRSTASVEKTQVSFIDYIVHPLWETWSELVHPDAQNILDSLDDNRDWYFNQITEDPKNEEQHK